MTAVDHALSTAKLATLVFPFLGPGVTFFEIVTLPMRGKRFVDWCEKLRVQLNALAERVKDLTPETLANSPEFVSAFFQATQSALRTHDEIKLEALRNAVLNTAIGSETLSDRRDVFLSLVDLLQPVHLRVLRVATDLKLTETSSLRQVIDLLSNADPGVRDLGDEGTTLVLRDLDRYGLIRMSEITVNNSSPFTLIEGCALTQWARSFLAFITTHVAHG